MPPVSGLPQNGGAKKRLPDDGTDQEIHEEGGSAHRKSSLRDSSLLRKRHDKRSDRTKVQYESARVPHIPANQRRCHDRHRQIEKLAVDRAVCQILNSLHIIFSI